MARAVRNRFPLFKGRTGRRCLAILAMAGLLVAGVGLEAGANLPGSSFEGNDGNFVVNGPSGNTDWAALNAAQQAALAVGADLPSGQTDNSFGNGTKESDTNVTVGLGSIPNSKADLGNFYITSETLASNNHVMMYLGWTRVNTSGTTNFDFEINQAAQPDLTTPGPKVLVRTAGDILIGYDFQGGAQTPTLTLRTWQANGTWSDAAPIVAPVGEAEVNRVPLANPLAVSPSPANAPAFTFGEAAIDLTAAGVVPVGECAPFSSAYVKSRASDAFTSAVKDFIAPQSISLDNCGEIIIEKVTDPASDTTTEFGFTLTGPGSTNKAFSLVNGGSDSTPGLQPGTYVATEATVPPGWDLDSAVCSDGSEADAIDLAASETVTCVFTNLARADLHIVKDAERGGVDFTFNADAPLNPATFILQDGGQQDYLDLVPGTYGAAEVIPEGWDLTSMDCSNGDTADAVTLGAGDDVTCTFVNNIERGALTIHKEAKHAADEDNVIPHAGVVFTITNANGTNVEVTTDANGNACAADLPVSLLDGDYTITETVPANYVNDAPVQSYTVLEDTTCESALPASFVNTPLTNITVTVDSLVVGGTASVIECGTASEATDPNSGDGSLLLENLVPGLYSCTILVDP